MAFRYRQPVQKVGSPAGRTTRTLTARERQIVASFLDAAAALERSVDSTLIQQLIRQGSTSALGSLDTGGFVTALEPMVAAIQAEIAAGGIAAIGELPTTLRGAYRFDALDPRAIAWAQTRAGALIAQVTDEQRAILNRVLARSIENGWTVAQTTQDLRQVIGLHDRWASAVSSSWDRDYDRLLRSGLSDALARQQADALADRYRNRLLQARARNIARTEILTAGNQGRWLSWAQGVDGGYISKNAMKQWTTGPLITRSPKRIQVCDICAGVRGEMRKWNEPFSNGVMMPPAHPSCRCSAELVPVSIQEVRDRLREADKPTPDATPENVKGWSGLQKYGVDGDLVMPDDVKALINANRETPFLHLRKQPELQAWEARVKEAMRRAGTPDAWESMMEGAMLRYRRTIVDRDKLPAKLVKAKERNLAKMLDEQPVVINVTEDGLLGVINDGRFKSQFETNTSKGLLDPKQRLEAERNVLNLPDNLDPTDRPIYGSIPKTYDGVPDDLTYNYGDYRVVLRDEVKDRTTWTCNDSLGQQFTASPVRAPEMEYLYWNQSKEGFSNYLETQIMGGVSVDDIAELLIRPYEAYANPTIVEFFKSRGITVRQWDYNTNQYVIL